MSLQAATKILIGQCDCCGKDQRRLHQMVWVGIDTAVCSACCDGDPENDRDELQSEIDGLLRVAETGEQWARIAQLECALVGLAQ